MAGHITITIRYYSSLDNDELMFSAIVPWAWLEMQSIDGILAPFTFEEFDEMFVDGDWPDSLCMVNRRAPLARQLLWTSNIRLVRIFLNVSANDARLGNDDDEDEDEDDSTASTSYRSNEDTEGDEESDDDDDL